LGHFVGDIKGDPTEEDPRRNVATMERALATSVDAPDYQEMLTKQDYFANAAGLEEAMNRCNYTMLISPAGSLAFQNFAAIGGNPVISVPMGFYPEGTKLKRDKEDGLVAVASGIP
jgi:amidase